MLSLKESTNSIPIAMTIDKKHTVYKSNTQDQNQNKIEFPVAPLDDLKSLIPYFDFKHMKAGKKSIRMFISGSTGSGKTYLCEQILKNSFKKAPVIYLFSSIWDEDYKDIKNLIHLDIDEFYESNPDIEDIYTKLHPNSVCIFDDILSLDDKKLKKYIKLRDQCLSVGRHKDISTICIEQQPRNYTKSRIVLLNSEMYIFFPKSSYMPFKKTCEEYIGLSKSKIEDLGKHRYIAIYKNYPSYYITDFETCMLEYL